MKDPQVKGFFGNKINREIKEWMIAGLGSVLIAMVDSGDSLSY